jgi:Uma2 family endonuclease
MPVAVQKLTWEDIKDFPESHGRTEIVDGELIVSPIASPGHQRICKRLARKIDPYVERAQMGEFFSHPVHIVLAVGVEYEPDQCFIRASRLPSLEETSLFRGPPDLIIEIVSDSNRSHDTVVKFRDYERYGVPEYWIVDPRDSHIRVFHLNDVNQYQLLGIFPKGEKIVSPTFPELALDPAEIFPA